MVYVCIVRSPNFGFPQFSVGKQRVIVKNHNDNQITARTHLHTHMHCMYVYVAYIVFETLYIANNCVRF